MEIHWRILSTPLGSMAVAATPAGVCAATLPGLKDDDFPALVLGAFPAATLVSGGGWADDAVGQLEEYFNGRRRAFELPLDLNGTDFQRRVWERLTRIPYGATATYAEVAAAIGRPRASRAVGGACGANPLPIIVPCHRVLASGGRLGGFGGGLEMKRALLRREGIEVPKKGDTIA